MEILVNREPLDFSLENESSVGEVVDGLAEWLRSGQFAITSLDVNETTYAIHDRSAWEDIDLGTVQELSVEALPLSEVDHATLVALDEYCSLLTECLQNRDATVLGELADELPYVRSRLGQFFPSLRDEAGAVPVLANEDLASARLPSPQTAEAILAEIDGVRTLLGTREREYREPARELALTLGQLSSLAPTLVDVPVQLQTGEQAAAMQSVIRFTELLARVVRLVPLAEASDDPGDLDMAGVRRFAEGTAPHLVELKEAFEAQDTVLVGDLLEYEIAPRLEQLPSLISGGGVDS